MRNVLVVAIIIKCKEKYLFIKQNKKDGAFQGCLHTVGGKIEENETPEEAIKRETLEEVNIDIKEVTPLDFDSEITMYKGEKSQLIALRYVAEVQDFCAKPSSDAKEVLWLSKDELLEYKQNPMTKRFLYKLGLITQEELKNDLR